MKKILNLLFILIAFKVNAQTFHPSAHVVVNDAIGQSQAAPLDARSMFFDSVNFVYRDYNGVGEVYSYLNLAAYRIGHIPIYVHVGGSLSGGVWTGGYTNVYFFRDSTTNLGLVRWYTDSAGLSGALLAANNLSDVANASTSRTNLGLGAMAQQNLTAASTDVTGNWPTGLIVNSIQGHNLTYIQNYNNLTNRPAIPAQFNPIAGTNISLSGIYPNITFNAVSTVSPTLQQVTDAGNTTDTSIYTQDSLSALIGTNKGTLYVGDTTKSFPFKQQDTIICYGNSIANNVGATYLGFFPQYCLFTNSFGIDSGLSGTCLLNASGILASFESRLPFVPHWSPHHKIMMLYETNDYFGSLPLITYVTGYDSILRALTAAPYNYPDSAILLNFCSYTNDTVGGVTPWGLSTWAYTLDSMAKSKGILYADLWHFMINNGGDSLVYSVLREHPNQTGHNVIAQDDMLCFQTGSINSKGTIFSNSIAAPDTLKQTAQVVQAIANKFSQIGYAYPGTSEMLTYDLSTGIPQTEIRGGVSSSDNSYGLYISGNQGVNLNTGIGVYTHTNNVGVPQSDSYGFNIVTLQGNGKTLFSTYAGPQSTVGGQIQVSPNNSNTGIHVYSDVPGSISIGEDFELAGKFISNLPFEHYGPTFQILHPSYFNATDKIITWRNDGTGTIDTLSFFANGSPLDTTWNGPLRIKWNTDIVNKIDSNTTWQIVMNNGHTSTIPAVVLDNSGDTATLSQGGLTVKTPSGGTMIHSNTQIQYTSPTFGILGYSGGLQKGSFVFNNNGAVSKSSNQIANSLGVVHGFFATDTMTAHANNDVLVAMDIEPLFRDSSFSNVTHIGIKSFGTTYQYASPTDHNSVQLYNKGDTEYFSIPVLPTGNFPGYGRGYGINLAIGMNAAPNLVVDTMTSGTYGKELTGSNNTIIGDSAGINMGRNNENTFVGWTAGMNTTDSLHGDGNFVGALNTGIGAWALRANKYGASSVAIGQKALSGDSVSNWNIAIGKETLASNNNPSGHNIAVGGWAGIFATGAAYDIYLGQNAGAYHRGTNCVFIGTNAGSNPNDTAEYNVMSNTFVAGSDSSGSAYTAVYFGKGYESATPALWTLRGTNAKGTNTAGGALGLAGGVQSGNGLGGPITFSTSQTVSAGTTPGFLSEIARFSSIANTSYGGLGLGTTTPLGLLDARFVVNNVTNKNNIFSFSDSIATFNTGSDQNFLVANLRSIAKATHSGGSGKLINAAAYFSASGADSNLALVTDSGNVGIGTTHPQFLLDVNGATNIRAQLTIPNIAGEFSPKVVIAGIDTTTGQLVKNWNLTNNVILNQNATTQTANFNISGSGLSGQFETTGGGAFITQNVQQSGTIVVGGRTSTNLIQTGSLLSDSANAIISGSLGSGGAIAQGFCTIITTGTSSTAPNNSSNILFNPASLIASYTLTLPPNPYDGQLENIYFGGTILGGSTVVTTLTISPNSGQAIEQQTAPTTGLGGTVYKYKYISAVSKWFRDQ